MRWRMVLVLILVLIVALAAAIIYGAHRWNRLTEDLHAGLDAGTVPVSAKPYEPADIVGLPQPVQRYFRAVLKGGQPLITGVRIEHTGTFNMSETTEKWKHFTSTQYVVTRRPGFVWDARIRMMPGLTVHVHDAYVAGEGILTAKIFGLVTVMDQPRTPELAEGELMRFLAEAAWYPTALLPNRGVVWEAIDDRHAGATLTDGEVSVELVFEFDDEGIISKVHSDGRYRRVDGEIVATPWEGRFRGYTLRNGMLIPLKGEVGWLPEGVWKPYWRGTIDSIDYRFD
jgi:hypothetical protein